jgi:hypothetical protein
MKYRNLFILPFVGLCLWSTAYSASDKQIKASLPLLNCHLKQVDQTIEVTLNTKPISNTQVYLIKNTSSYPVFIDHSTGRKGASAGWLSTLDSNQWSAIAVSKSAFKLQCYISQNGKMDQTDCNILKVCQPVATSLTAKNAGDYWLVENRPWDKLVAGLRKRGVEF